MSQFADHCETMRELVEKYPGEESVIEAVFELITNQDWDSDDLIEILECGKGISPLSDSYIERYVEQIRSW